MKRLLVVVDMQNDFTTGALSNVDAQNIIPNIVSKVEQYIDRGDIVIFTRDTHESNYLLTEEGINLPVMHCIRDTVGWQIIDELLPYVKIVFDKTTFGSVELAAYASEQEFDVIELVGVCTDICVISCALTLKAACPNAHIIVDSSCCAGVTIERHNTALSALSACHVEII